MDQRGGGHCLTANKRAMEELYIVVCFHFVTKHDISRKREGVFKYSREKREERLETEK